MQHRRALDVPADHDRGRRVCHKPAPLHHQHCVVEVMRNCAIRLDASENTA